jgi:hypothetical protein
MPNANSPQVSNVPNPPPANSSTLRPNAHKNKASHTNPKTIASSRQDFGTRKNKATHISKVVRKPCKRNALDTLKSNAAIKPPSRKYKTPSTLPPTLTLQPRKITAARKSVTHSTRKSMHRVRRASLNPRWGQQRARAQV